MTGDNCVFGTMVTSQVPRGCCLCVSQELAPKCLSSQCAVSPLTCCSGFFFLFNPWRHSHRVALVWRRAPVSAVCASPASSPSSGAERLCGEGLPCGLGSWCGHKSVLWFLSFDSNSSLGAALWILILPACPNCSPQLVIVN